MNRFFTFLVLIYTSTLFAQPDLNFNQIYNIPGLVTVIENAGDASDRLFIGNQTGIIYVRKNGVVDTDNPFLNIDALTNGGGEQGLLGMAFHPDYQNNGYFYLNYTNLDNNTTIARCSVSSENPDVADLSSLKILFSYNQPNSNHNGGDITFGSDGYLYIASGDGGGSGDPDETGQDETQLLGKILRIDVDGTGSHASSNACGIVETDVGKRADYGIPPTNPFVGNDGQCDEIYATGLRNPWRISFDNDDDLWIADVGQRAYEEINLYQMTAPAGLNFGWDCLEGFEDYDNLPPPYPSPGSSSSECSNDPTNDPNYTDPVYAYAHDLVDETGGSITGGFLYEGTQIDGLQGYYLFADISDGTFSALSKASALISNPMVRTYDNFPGVGITTFGEDESGEIYFGTFSGSIYRISGTVLPLQLINFSGKINSNKSITLDWNIATAQNVNHFIIEKSTDGNHFTELAQVDFVNGKTLYQITDTKPSANANFYRLKIVDTDDSFGYSKIIQIQPSVVDNFTILPNPNRGQFLISWQNPNTQTAQIQIRIYNKLGKIVQIYPFETIQFPYEKMVDLSEKLPAGIYTVEVNSDTDIYRKQVVVE